MHRVGRFVVDAWWTTGEHCRIHETRKTVTHTRAHCTGTANRTIRTHSDSDATVALGNTLLQNDLSVHGLLYSIRRKRTMCFIWLRNTQQKSHCPKVPTHFLVSLVSWSWSMCRYLMSEHESVCLACVRVCVSARMCVWVCACTGVCVWIVRYVLRSSVYIIIHKCCFFCWYITQTNI